MDNRGGEVIIVPPEYYGLMGAGGAVSQFNQERENRKRYKKEVGMEEEKIGLERQKVGIEQENAVIQRANTLLESAEPSARQAGLDLLKRANLAPTDARVRIRPEEFQGDQYVAATQKPVTERTDDDIAVLGKYLNLPAGMTAEDARRTAKMHVDAAGLDLEKLLHDKKTQDQYDEWMLKKGWTPGRMQAEKEFLGYGQARADIAKTQAETGLIGAQKGLVGAQTTLTRAQAVAKEDPLQQKIGDIYGNTLATWGVPYNTTMKVVRGQKLTDQEEEQVTVALTNAAQKAMESKNTTEMLSVLSTMLKDPGHGGVMLDSSMRATATALLFNKMFGKDVMKTEETTSWTGRKGIVLVPDMKLINKLLGGKDETLENIKAMVAKAPDLDVALAEAQTTNNAYKPLIIQAIEEEARRRGVQVQATPGATTTPAAPQQPTTPKPESQLSPAQQRRISIMEDNIKRLETRLDTLKGNPNAKPSYVRSLEEGIAKKKKELEEARKAPPEKFSFTGTVSQ